MPTPTTYYLNGPSLGSSSSVFTDAGLTTCAPDGYYSDGVIVRQQVDCLLLPQQTCPTCATACGGTAGISTANSGAFVANIEVGAGLGVIVVKFNPFTVPDGIKVEYNSVIYNQFSSVAYGYLAGPAGLPVFLGRLSDDCITTGTPYVLDEYVYDGSNFVSSGNAQTVTVSSPQKVLTANSPMNCVMVIPKTSASPSVVTVTVYGVCGDTLSAVSVGCPSAPSEYYYTGYSSASSAALCLAAPGAPTRFCFVAVTGDGNIISLYDWVFTDDTCVTRLSDGYYRDYLDSTRWFKVQDGVIVQFGNCP